MAARKTKLESLTVNQIDKITASARKKKRVPLVASRQVNMRLDPSTLEKVKKLAEVQGIPYTTFLARLLKEDIERLWGVFDKTA
jgi:predicted DNA binding CopG/RHH family protein